MPAARLSGLSIVLVTLGTGHAAVLSGWSDPVTLVDEHGRLALGSRLHVVDHTGGNLVHRFSLDDGATWIAPTLRDHVHLVVRKHRHLAEQMIANLQAASRDAVLAEGLRPPDHPVWGEGRKKVYAVPFSDPYGADSSAGPEAGGAEEGQAPTEPAIVPLPGRAHPRFEFLADPIVNGSPA